MLKPIEGLTEKADEVRLGGINKTGGLLAIDRFIESVMKKRYS